MIQLINRFSLDPVDQVADLWTVCRWSHTGGETILAELILPEKSAKFAPVAIW